MKCPSCQFENPDLMNFCGNCGNPLTVKCPECSHHNRVGSESCELCGGRLPPQSLPAYAKHTPEDYTPSFLKKEFLKLPGSLEGERKMVSVLFADVTGFTAMSEKMSAGKILQILNEYYELIVDIVFYHEGTVDKFIGDAIMVIWGAPVDHEDDPSRAVRSALDIQRELVKFNEILTKKGLKEFRVGIGINTGSLVAGYIGSTQTMSYSVIGDTVNTASRICSAAKPNEIIISQKTYDAVHKNFNAEALEPINAKGKYKPVRVFKVTGEK